MIRWTRLHAQYAARRDLKLNPKQAKNKQPRKWDPASPKLSNLEPIFCGMETHHRKIDLQSPSDLTYLLNNIKAAAQEKLDLAIPPSAAPEGEDAYRTKVEELVQEVPYTLLSSSLAFHDIVLKDCYSTSCRPSPSLSPTSPSTVSIHHPHSFAQIPNPSPTPTRTTMETTNLMTLVSPRNCARSTRTLRSNLRALRN